MLKVKSTIVFVQPIGFQILLTNSYSMKKKLLLLKANIVLLMRLKGIYKHPNFDKFTKWLFSNTAFQKNRFIYLPFNTKVYSELSFNAATGVSFRGLRVTHHIWKTT